MDENPPAEVGLFAELPPNGLREFEITASLPDSECPAMTAIAPAMLVVSVFADAFANCQSLPDFELKVRPLGSSTP